MTADAIPPGDHELNVVSTADGSEQPYRLCVPHAAAGDTLLPLLVILHGREVDQNAWFELTPVKEVAAQYGYLVAAPNGRGDAYYDGPGEQDVLDVIERIKRDCHVDVDRVYLAGHSMGGWGTWYIGLRHPDLFAAICPMAGMAPLELMPNARHLAPYIIHDSGDEVVRVESSRRAGRRLAELGIAFQYREESGFGHSSTMIGANLRRVLDWFDGHRRMRRPDRVTFFVGPGESGCAYWVRIPPTAPWLPAHFGVDARVEPPRRLLIRTEHLIRLVIERGDLPFAREGPLSVDIDGQHLSLEQPGRWAVLSRTLPDRMWTCTCRDSRPELRCE